LLDRRGWIYIYIKLNYNLKKEEEEEEEANCALKNNETCDSFYCVFTQYFNFNFS